MHLDVVCTFGTVWNILKFETLWNRRNIISKNNNKHKTCVILLPFYIAFYKHPELPGLWLTWQGHCCDLSEIKAVLCKGLSHSWKSSFIFIIWMYFMLVAGYLLAQGLILEGGHSIGCGPRGRYAAGCDRLSQTGPRSASLFPQKICIQRFWCALQTSFD